MRLVGSVVVLLLPARVLAGPSLEYVEHLFGATNVNAVAGHGALTAGFAADGDVTVLSWPGPGRADQLLYLSSNAIDARARPHFGALDGMGTYLGLVVTTPAGPALTFLRDAPWTHAQAYSRPDAAVVVTTFRHAALGLVVTVTDVVSPDVDVLSRNVVVQRQLGSTVTAVSLAVYENLSPSLSEIPELPIGDWALDSANDFLAAWDPDAQAILHFHPGDRGVYTLLVELAGYGDYDLEFGAVDALMQQAAPGQPAIDGLVRGIDAAYPPGVAALVTTEPPPAGHQVGSDATATCAAVDQMVDNLVALPQTDPGIDSPLNSSNATLLRCREALPRLRAAHAWLWQPEDALSDLADRTLSGSSLAAGQTNGSLRTPLAFTGDRAEGTVLFAFGDTRAAARRTLDAARAQTFAARQAASEKATRDAIAGLPLPDASLGDRVVQVAERALVNLYVARDRRNGAFLAAVTTQPPYYLDWPRDGAFLSVALDLGGPDTTAAGWVTARHIWYTSVIRDSFTTGNPLLSPMVPLDPDTGMRLFPQWAWEMNYFPDGEVGGPTRFEIDNTALHVWATAVHAGTLQGQARKAFLDAIWPTDKLALDLLARWRDPTSGLQALANEDDNLKLTQSLHGAAAVYTGLVAGARLGHAAGDDDSANRYLARAKELHDAITTAYRNPATGLYRPDPIPPGAGSVAPTGWLVWPARFFDPGDAALEAQLSSDMDHVLAELTSTSVRGATYSAKNVVAAARFGQDGPGGARDKARQAVHLLADVATPDTLHFGEVFLRTPGGWSNQTATPHVWEGILFYLSAMALGDSGRAAFDADARALPLPSSGCGCRVGDRGRGGGAAVLLLLALAVVRTRTSRPRPPAPRRPDPRRTGPGRETTGRPARTCS